MVDQVTAESILGKSDSSSPKYIKLKPDPKNTGKQETEHSNKSPLHRRGFILVCSGHRWSDDYSGEDQTERQPITCNLYSWY